MCWNIDTHTHTLANNTKRAKGPPLRARRPVGFPTTHPRAPAAQHAAKLLGGPAHRAQERHCAAAESILMVVCSVGKGSSSCRQGGRQASVCERLSRSCARHAALLTCLTCPVVWSGLASVFSPVCVTVVTQCATPPPRLPYQEHASASPAPPRQNSTSARPAEDACRDGQYLLRPSLPRRAPPAGGPATWAFWSFTHGAHGLLQLPCNRACMQAGTFGSQRGIAV